MFPKLRVHIKDNNNNSPHGKSHRFFLPFSSKFPDLNFAPYVLYIYSCYETRTWHKQSAWVTCGQILNSMHEGDGFSPKTIRKKLISFANWQVWPASSDKWKAPLVPLRRHHFAPFAQVTSAGQQACQGLPYEFRPVLQCFLQGQPSPEESIASLCLHWAALYAAGEDLLLSCPVFLEEKKELIPYSFLFLKFHDFPWINEWMNNFIYRG